MHLLEVKNLKVKIDGKDILNGLNLSVKKGEVHAIMGPNGSGKSTLASVLAGRQEYEVTGGEVLYKGNRILEFSPEERARMGLFLAFQYPVEIPGVTNANFLKTALNEIRKSKNLAPLDSKDFLILMKEKMKLVEIDKSMTQRSVNEGFSGGEKKRNEIFQMAMLEPELSVLDGAAKQQAMLRQEAQTQIEAVKAALSQVIDPNTRKDLQAGKSVKNIRLDGADVAFDVELGYPATR